MGGSVSSGFEHTCSINQLNIAYCWGDQTFYQLGYQSTLSTTSPVAVYPNGALSGKTISNISSGGVHTCVFGVDDASYCWGSNSYFQLGIKMANAYKQLPTAVSYSDGKNITKFLSSGYLHTCAIYYNDQAYCWGTNSDGRIGNGSTTNYNYPIRVSLPAVLN